MNLFTLRAGFIRYEERYGHIWLPRSRSLVQAHGVELLCPKCYRAHGGPRGTHGIICWFRDCVPAEATPGPGRWDPIGTGLSDLTLSPSIHLTGPGCGWHGYVRDGAIVDA